MHRSENDWIWIPEYDGANALSEQGGATGAQQGAAPGRRQGGAAGPRHEDEAYMVCFRRTMMLETVPETFCIRITADTRYKLYINGRLCSLGPLKGDREVWFYDEPDVAEYLHQGVNVWAVEVLRYPADLRQGNMSLFRTATPGLYIRSVAEDASGEPLWQTDRHWRCMRRRGYHIVSENPWFAPLQIYESVQGDPAMQGWMAADYDDSGWMTAREYDDHEIAGNISPGNMKARDIPFMQRIPRRFVGISRVNTLALHTEAGTKVACEAGMQGADTQEICAPDGDTHESGTPEHGGAIASDSATDAWTAFLQGQRTIEIPPQSVESVDLDAGELMTGFLHLAVAGGCGTRITLKQAECYMESVPEQFTSYDDLPVKGDRSDAEHGVLYGNQDVYVVGGAGDATGESFRGAAPDRNTGTAAGMPCVSACEPAESMSAGVARPEIYEPFWFRTFRYIRLTIETGDAPLRLLDLHYDETGYPLEVRTHVETSDQTMQAIWDISLRTLRRCMHETYMDCPYYEQLQYAMDARTEILYTYAVSADDRLARHCMEDFRRSQHACGLLAQSYPCTGNGVIPGFSIYYIGMLYDHMMYYGDRAFLERHMPTVEGILGYYHRNLDERGLVGKIGDLNRPDCYWSFIDWTPEWNATNGVPAATLQGPITMESLLYILGLQYSTAILRYLGRDQDAGTYAARAVAVQAAVNTWCRGRDGLYTDGPGVAQYSQHCQVFAVLTGTVPVAEGRALLAETLEHKENYAQCSVAMLYYLFRALEMCDLYNDYTQGLWDIYRGMLNNHLTTCAEDPVGSRSDCHAWGALALYELPSVILGVRPTAPGYASTCGQPLMGGLAGARGDVVTPAGMVHAEWV